MSKFYAIRKGNEIGIVNTWKECQERTKGFKGAEFKSFTNLEDAIKYMKQDKHISTEHIPDTLYVYVDGSYNEPLDIVGYGLVAVINGKEIYRDFNGFKEHPHNKSRNVFGEILGAIEAIEFAMQNKYTEVTIAYDYKGIECWATKEWKAQNEMTQTYVRYIDYVKNKIKINFLKIQAHTGNTFNELADELAKKGAKLI